MRVNSGDDPPDVLKFDRGIIDDRWAEDVVRNLTDFEMKTGGKKSLIELDDDDDDQEDSGVRGWTSKKPEVWDEVDVKHWLFWASTRLGMLYRDIPAGLVVPGNELVRFSRNDFVARSERFGGKLYDSLPRVHVDYNSKGANKKRKRGRPPKLNSKPKPRQTQKLWEFVRNLLLDRRYCPQVINWVDYESKKFRFVDTVKVAKLWGSRISGNGNNSMTYAKFSRALRYYYKIAKCDIIRPVKKRLVYQFGPKATGLKTDNPNFEINELEKSKAPAVRDTEKKETSTN